jgi:hypothetical protein
VADIGDVLDMEDRDPVVQDHPPDEIGEQERPEIADVGVAVDRRPAGVHPEALTVQRLHRLDRPREGVAKAKRHVGIVAAETAIAGMWSRGGLFTPMP